jgi:hypothetical protein
MKLADSWPILQEFPALFSSESLATLSAFYARHTTAACSDLLFEIRLFPDMPQVDIGLHYWLGAAQHTRYFIEAPFHDPYTKTLQGIVAARENMDTLFQNLEQLWLEYDLPHPAAVTTPPSLWVKKLTAQDYHAFVSLLDITLPTNPGSFLPLFPEQNILWQGILLPRANKPWKLIRSISLAQLEELFDKNILKDERPGLDPFLQIVRQDPTAKLQLSIDIHQEDEFGLEFLVGNWMLFLETIGNHYKINKQKITEIAAWLTASATPFRRTISHIKFIFNKTGLVSIKSYLSIISTEDWLMRPIR